MGNRLLSGLLPAQKNYQADSDLQKRIEQIDILRIEREDAFSAAAAAPPMRKRLTAGSNGRYRAAQSSFSFREVWS